MFQKNISNTYTRFRILDDQSELTTSVKQDFFMCRSIIFTTNSISPDNPKPLHITGSKFLTDRKTMTPAKAHYHTLISLDELNKQFEKINLPHIKFQIEIIDQDKKLDAPSMPLSHKFCLTIKQIEKNEDDIAVDKTKKFLNQGLQISIDMNQEYQDTEGICLTNFWLKHFLTEVESEYKAVIQKEQEDLQAAKQLYRILNNDTEDIGRELKSLKKTSVFVMFFLKICYAIRAFLFKDFASKYNEMKKEIEIISEEYIKDDGVMNYKEDANGDKTLHEIGEDIIKSKSETKTKNIYNYLDDPKNTRQKNFFLTKLDKEIEKKERSRPNASSE